MKGFEIRHNSSLKRALYFVLEIMVKSNYVTSSTARCISNLIKFSRELFKVPNANVNSNRLAPLTKNQIALFAVEVHLGYTWSIGILENKIHLKLVHDDETFYLSIILFLVLSKKIKKSNCVNMNKYVNSLMTSFNQRII